MDRRRLVARRDRRSSREEYLSINESYIHIIDVAHRPGHDHHPAAGRPEGRARRPPATPKWSKDGKSIYYITDKGSEFRRLARHDLVTGADAVADRGRSPGTSRSYDLSDDGTLIAAGGQRGRQRRAPRVRGRDRQVETTGPQAARRPDLRAQVPDRVARDRLHPQLGPGRVRRVLARPRRERSACGAPSAGPRARPAGSTPRRSPSRRWSTTRRFDDRKIPAFVYRPPAGRFPGPQAGADRDPRRPRGAVPPRLPGPAQLPGQRAGAGPDHAQRPRLVGLRQDLPQARQRHAPRGRRQGHRRPCSTGSPSSPTSTRAGSA